MQEFHFVYLVSMGYSLILMLLGKEITRGKFQWRKLKYVSFKHELFKVTMINKFKKGAKR